MRAPGAIVLSVVLFVCTSGAASAIAGIHNVQSILATEAEPGLSGAITASADWRTGNVSFLFLSATPLARYRAGNNLLIAILRGERKTRRDATIVSRTFEHVRYRRTVSDWLLAEGFIQHEFDGVRRLEIRALAGAGLKADLVEGERYGLGLGLAYMVEYEQLSDATEVSDSGEDDLAHRLSSYAVGHYQIDDRLQLVETVYAQPRLTGAGDLRLLSESSLTIKATTRVSLKTAFTVAYDSEPPQTIERLDTSLISSVIFEL